MAMDEGNSGDVVPPMAVPVATVAAGGDRFKRHNKAGNDTTVAYHSRKPAQWRKYVAAGKQQQQQQRARQQQHRRYAAVAAQQHHQQQQQQHEHDASDGWTFWSSIYTDREQSMAAAAAAYNAPPIAAVLSAERVRRSRVLLDRLPWGVSESQLAALVADTLAPSAHAMAVHCRPAFAKAKASLANGAVLTFYTPESACVAVRALDGCSMRGRRVRATLLCHGGGVQHGAQWADARYTHAWTNSATGHGDQQHTVAHNTWSTHTAVESAPAVGKADAQPQVDTWRSSGEITVLRHCPKQVYDTSGTGHLMKMFKQVVLRHGAMLYTDDRLSQLAAQADRAGDTAPLAYDAWPLAFARLCANSTLVPLTMHGPYLRLGHYDHQCRVSRPYTDRWEPMAPSEIVSLSHWCDYVSALVHHMGPLHVHDAAVYYACAHMPHGGALPTHDPWSMCAAAVSAMPDRLMLADGVLHALHAHHGRVDAAAGRPTRR